MLCIKDMGGFFYGGDFNARTNTVNDFIENDEVDEFYLLMSVTNQIINWKRGLTKTSVLLMGSRRQECLPKPYRYKN